MMWVEPVFFSHVAIIYNPASTGSGQAKAEELAQQLTAAGLKSVELVGTKHAGHAQALALELAMRHERPLVISSSGDGGYHEVVAGLMQAQLAGQTAVAAVLPAGNANDHRRSVARAPLAESIVAGRTKPIDLLRVQVAEADTPPRIYYAHSYIGLGLTPEVAAELNRHSLSAWREGLIVARALWRLQPFEIRVDGRLHRLDSLVFSNIPEMAKVLTLAPDARPDDGHMRVNYFPAGSKLALLVRLLRAATIGLGASRPMARYQFETVQALPIQLDGEVANLPADARVTVSVASHALESVL